MSKILVIGSGGREHAIAFAFGRFGHTVFVSPGNPGMEDDATIVPKMDFKETADFTEDCAIDLVFIGPEQPLTDGIVDYLQERDIDVVGPTKAAARIEGSKAFAKDIMRKSGVPTAAYKVFDQFDDADTYLKSAGYPQVIKADGLAAGKGVVIAQNYDEARSALEAMMRDKVFGESGSRVVIEEFLVGWEASVFAFTDGEHFVTTVFSQDHKPLLDGDQGPNTGGMGAYAPVKSAEKYRDRVEKEIFEPVLKTMRDEGCMYKGILYAGLMITEDGPKVVEFNCRFGDPETEVVLPLLNTDLYEISRAIIDNRIDEIKLNRDAGFAVTVVAASGGYPGKYMKNKLIQIDDGLRHKIYFAGVGRDDGKLVTAGGRVMMITAQAETLEEARHAAYNDMSRIHFEGMQYRSDIGEKDSRNL